jgi:3-oxoacyl-[acyl-carrier-protein] synthase II
MKRRVVITGLGAITPIGNDVASSWANAKKGVNGIDTIKGFDITDFAVTLAGEIKDFDFIEYFGKKKMKRMDRFVQLAVIASKEAMEDSRINMDEVDSDRVGVYYGSGIGGLGTIANNEDKGRERGFDRVSPFFIPSAIINMAAAAIAIDYQTHGIVTSNVTACASATNSIGEAFRAIRDGYLEVCITGGSEASIVPLGIGGFSVMHALSKSKDKNRASIPFDQERSGFVMGEGAGTLILEEYEHALARGAKIYAEVVGYGATCDAVHITSPAPDGEGAKKCMEMALRDGGIELSEVSYINAHGTSTPLNDKTETLAIKRAFGDLAKDISISSTKSMTGHLLGASGAIEAIFSVLSTMEDFVPPTINFKVADPECDLDYTVNGGKKRIVNIAISNSLGFGGHNATIAIKKYKGE